MHHIVPILLSILIIHSSNTCKIKLTIISRTIKPFLFQAIVPSLKTKTAVTEFVYKDQIITTMVEGKNCYDKRWIMKTWKKAGKKWVAARERRMRLDGNGKLNVTVGDSLIPVLDSRMGILCSHGPC
uniref:Secreted protein n=1 Tax=Ascaris lumbricoides TaxID=6252 RepID=A0A0M3IHD2_ASCLU